VPEPGGVRGHEHIGADPANLSGERLAKLQRDLDLSVDPAEEDAILDPERLARGEQLLPTDAAYLLAGGPRLVGTRRPVAHPDVRPLGARPDPFRRRTGRAEFGVVRVGEGHESSLEVQETQTIRKALDPMMRGNQCNTSLELLDRSGAVGTSSPATPALAPSA